LLYNFVYSGCQVPDCEIKLINSQISGFCELTAKCRKYFNPKFRCLSLFII